MIDHKSYSLDWVQEKRGEFNNADPLLVEKVIRAFALLEALCRQNLKFIFKGGTSLLLLLPKPLRFSIDIDIIIEKKPDDLEALLQRVISRTDFTRCEEDIRSRTDIPKKHFKFYYQSILPGQGEQYILLDILFQENPYPNVIFKLVNSSFISIDGKPERVRLPDVNSILGDKLTAFAPATIGIPPGSGKELEMIKQLYDIGQLFNRADDLKLVGNSFELVAQFEIDYRSKTIDPNDVLADTFYAGQVLSLRGKKDEKLYKELEAGIRKIEPYIFKRFKIDDALVSSAKAAYLTQLLASKSTSFERFDKEIDLSDRLIEGKEYNRLNKIKKTSPEAFFYWLKAIELIKAN